MGLMLERLLEWWTIRACHACKFCVRRGIVLVPYGPGRVVRFCRFHCVGVEGMDECEDFKRSWWRRVRFKKRYDPPQDPPRVRDDFFVI